MQELKRWRRQQIPSRFAVHLGINLAQKCGGEKGGGGIREHSIFRPPAATLIRREYNYVSALGTAAAAANQ